MAQPVQPEKAYFKDDGSIPNSALPLLVYRQAFVLGASDLAATIEERFARNDWPGRPTQANLESATQLMKIEVFQPHCDSHALRASFSWLPVKCSKF